MNLSLQPHPASRTLIAEEAERAAQEGRQPYFTDAKTAYPELGQEILDGGKRIGYYGGYGPGHGLSLIVWLQPPVKEAVVQFVTEHPEGGAPGRVGMVPPPAPKTISPAASADKPAVRRR